MTTLVCAHTPGPWNWQHNTGRLWLTAAVKPPAKGGLPFTRIADLNRKPTLGDAEANARLIAAAPDMKAALLTASCPGGGWNGRPDRLIDICTVKDCLDHGVCGCNLGDAIKKAEGRALVPHTCGET